MQKARTSRRTRLLLLAARSTGIFAVVYYYVLLRICPELFYQQRPNVFLVDSSHFFQTVGHPGGVVDYFSAFLSPLFVWDWLGAFVATSLIMLIGWATRAMSAPAVRRVGEVAHFIPPVLVLMVLGQYIHPVQLCVGLGITLVTVNLYTRLGGRGIAIRAVLLAIASAVVYFAVGGLYVLFACLCGFHEWFARRQRTLALACLLGAVAVPYVASWWPFDLTWGEAYQGLGVPEGDYWLSIPSSAPKAVIIHTAALISPILVALYYAWRERFLSAATPNREEPQADSTTTDPRSSLVAWLGGWAVPMVVALLILLVDPFALDKPKRCLLEVESQCEQQHWEKALEWARELPLPDERAYDPRTLYCINRALYFKGQLLEEMFAYPQVLGTPALTLIHQDIDTTSHLTPRQCSEIFFDLGRVNESEQMTYEVLEQCGNRPESLKRLARIYAIKGQKEAAKRFLGVLDRSLLHRGWARQMRRQIEMDSQSPDPSLDAYRAMMVQQDSLGDASNVEVLLKGLLDSNPRNRMAFEYLEAHYLLSCQLDKLLEERGRFDHFDDGPFPRHVEEALACYLATTGRQDEDIGRRTVRPETWGRFVEFLETEQQSQGDRDVAFEALYDQFHDTYFFALVFGHNVASLGDVKPPE